MAFLPNATGKVFHEILAGIDTPRSLAVKLLIEHEEWAELTRMSVDPTRYLDGDSYFRDAVATELLRKCAGLPTGIDTKAVATAGFFTAEKQCFETNLRLSRVFTSPDVHSGRIIEFIDDVKREVARVLGRLPDDLSPRFGPGATFECRSKLTTIPDKMSGRPTITREARCLLPLWSQTAWARGLTANRCHLSDPVSCRGNRFTTVPKDATKDRGICVEPNINVFYQLGVGRFIRNRLGRIGIDLDEGQALHRRVAGASSLTGEYATIDLSSASDTLSHELVRLVCPALWFELLSTLRSPRTYIDGRWVFLEKFSSMGNGFTFELETLIFACICRAYLQRTGGDPDKVLVYGDDILVPDESALEILSVLRFFGFTPNTRKTFHGSVPFRESCGGDFYRGEAVRPHYLKELPYEPQHWIAFANGIRRLWSGKPDMKSRLWKAWLMTTDQLPVNVRWLRGPEILGDLLLHDEPSKWRCRVKDSIRSFRVYQPVINVIGWEHFYPHVVLAAALYGCQSVGVAPRGSVAGYRLGWVPFS